MGTAPKLRPASPKRRYLLFFLIPLIGLASIPSIEHHLRASSLLLRIQNADDHSRLATYHTYGIGVVSSTLAVPNGTVRARIYTPVGRSNPPGIVVVHGVHHLGVDEPRLVAFSRALCASGFRVFTPELPDLADYHVSRSSLDIIGTAVDHLSYEMKHPVGVLGLSFAGGEALLTAADPRYASRIAYVVSIGAHDDMRRVADFFVTGKIARPDGSIASLKPHEYGPLVLMYSHLDEFFPVADQPTAQQALRYLLWEQVEDSRRASVALSGTSLAKMNALYQHDDSAMLADLQKCIAHHAQEMETVSPHDHLAALRVPVLLLHGTGDDVVPATEMLWLEKDVPHDYLRGALATPLLSHVSIAGEPPVRDKAELVHFMAKLIDLGDESRSHELSTAR
ncbi:MAG TPA: alpha/beta hydrolase [Terriglobales bacterium]|nr:alpha/beta hydrolase [Terriglobales bacterium]